ncbi:MAG: enoyl-CoA hydratase/isomerase family protein [Burkholderiales bacterium]
MPESSPIEPVVTSRRGAIGVIVLNNPTKLNALTKAMWTHLRDRVLELGGDDTLRAIVVRGAGDKAFAAGADISEFATERANSTQARDYGTLIHEAMQAVAQCRHPTVALIQGACIGGGLEIAAMCDMRVCGASSRFGVPINRLGLTMGYGELQGLLALAGRAVTLELLLEGRIFDAAEAYAKGLVNRVVPDAEVEAEAFATAQRIAAGAPLVARWHKRFIERLSARAELAPAEWDEGFACFDTEDYREGIDAFLGKRKPRFQGR